MGNKTGHRVLFTAFLLIAAMAMLTSCRTISGEEASAGDCDYTLHLVMDQTQEQTIQSLFMNLNSYRQRFIPSQYSFLILSEDSIPGMKKLIDQWSRQVTDFIIANYDAFTELSNSMVSDITFPDPQQLVSSSNNSITVLYSDLYYNAMAETIRAKFEEVDLTNWERIVIQYNAWVSTQALLGDTDLEKIIDSDIETKVSDLITELYFTFFSQQETLIRTTPDPDMDTTAARILGLD